MPEYVYALHDFLPEHDDEISFSAGDRIEVIEKDDMYGDGWWQVCTPLLFTPLSPMPRPFRLNSANVFRHLKGKNLFGKIGLFPQSYTTSDAAVLQPQPTPQNGATSADIVAAPTDSSLQTLNEESTSNVETPNGKKSSEGNDGVMRATMTDVQEAIEQLGRNNRDGNGSFSFASSRSHSRSRATLNSEHETDTDGGLQSNEEENGEAWHKGARSNLAEKARRQQELLRKEQEAYDEELRRHAPVITEQISEPRIEFELSDESEDEHEHEHEPGSSANAPFGRRKHEHISEAEEEDEDQVPLKVLKEINKSSQPTTPRTPKGARPSTAPSGQRLLSSPWSAGTDAPDDSLGPPPETARQQHFPPAPAAGTNGVSEVKALNGDAAIKASEVASFLLILGMHFFFAHAGSHIL